MVPNKEDATGYAQNCKICNHPLRADIEKEIRSRKAYAKIAKDYPGLNRTNLREHWINHMAPVQQDRVNQLLEEEAVNVKDSIKELTSLFDEHDTVFKQLLSQIDPMSPDYVKSINALRGLINTRIKMVKLNVELLGDTKQKRDTIDLLDALKAAKKEIEKNKKDSKVIAEVKK